MIYRKGDRMVTMEVKSGVRPAYAHFLSARRGLCSIVDWFVEYRYDKAIYRYRGPRSTL